MDAVRAVGRRWRLFVWLWLQLIVISVFVYTNEHPSVRVSFGVPANQALPILASLVLLFPGLWVVNAFLSLMPGSTPDILSAPGFFVVWFLAAGITYVFWAGLERWVRSALARHPSIDGLIDHRHQK